MDTTEAVSVLRAGGERIVFDTNAVHGVPRLIKLCAAIKRVNLLLRLASQPEIDLFLSTLVLGEALFHDVQKLQEKYASTAADDLLKSLGVTVEPFESTHAKEFAAQIGRLYPTQEAWWGAKRQSCIGCLGLARDAVCASCGTAYELQGTGKGCGATVDRLVAAHAAAEQMLLVTNDRDGEFRGLRKVKLETLEAALAMVLGPTAAAPATASGTA